MVIHYKTKRLEKILTDERLMKKYYTKIYNGLTNRLYELSSVRNLSLISHKPPPRKHKLSGTYEGFYSVDVSPNYRLLFTTPFSSTTNDDEITEIIIEEITDTH